jgi:hypothetical protein
VLHRLHACHPGHFLSSFLIAHAHSFFSFSPICRWKACDFTQTFGGLVRAVKSLSPSSQCIATSFSGTESIYRYNYYTSIAFIGGIVVVVIASCPSECEARFLSTSSSFKMSRFVERLEASVYSLSSLRTIPSWRSTLSRAHKTPNLSVAMMSTGILPPALRTNMVERRHIPNALRLAMTSGTTLFVADARTTVQGVRIT